MSKRCSSDSGGHDGRLFFTLEGLPAEVIRRSLTYALSYDLRALTCTCKAVADTLVSESSAVVTHLLKHAYSVKDAAASSGNGADFDSLRFAELKHVATLLAAPEAAPGRGYYVSKQWANNFRRFVESQARLRKASTGGGSSSGKQLRRLRSDSGTMPPCPDVNADLTCSHGALSPAGATRGRRRTLDGRSWRAIKVFYPAARDLRVRDGECARCGAERAAAAEAAQAAAAQEKERRSGDLAAVPALSQLCCRRGGVPTSHLVCGDMRLAIRLAHNLDALPPPLAPGLYHLVPRCWLSSWRTYVRDPGAPQPRPLDASLLLCDAHGLLLVPPHAEQWLRGDREKLLGALDTERSGYVCEVVTVDEWDALSERYGPCDFSVRFSIAPDGDAVAWSLPRCSRCDPCYVAQTYTTRVPRKLSF
ncbi:hypothetical protein JKP88DRAFT_324355 [Tribonema minus]|uniref:F-box domain-containing protein n=1 Tax=Tribonema minus TaxID=303371 RepID=A0A835YTC4_9STRA|nr:hypothetical protein JKP88DRAFT_324355 [Tribonema minus]